MAVRGGSWSVGGFRLPEFGITEKIQSVVSPKKPLTAQGGSSLFGSAQVSTGTYGQGLQQQTQAPYGPGLNSQGQPTYQPQTSGQGAGAGGGQQFSLQGPTAPQETGQGDIGILRDQYGVARQGLEQQGGQLDQSYALSKGDIEGALGDAQQTATVRKQENDSQFGSLLRQGLQTYQDLNRQRSGIFSNLGSLDSSSFQEQQYRGDQEYGQLRNNTLQQQQRSGSEIDRQFDTYKRQADSELARLGLTYQQGKQQIASAIANNDLSQASAVKGYLDQIRQRAAEVQNMQAQFANQVEMLKAQGVNVKTAIAGQNPDAYQQQFSLQTANQRNALAAITPQQQAGVQGQGYIIGKDGKKRDQQGNIIE